MIRRWLRWNAGKDQQMVVVLTLKQYRALRFSRHPIIIGIWAAFIAVSLLQLFHGPAPGSVNTDMPYPLQVVLSVTVILGAACNLTAAWIPHDWYSLGLELVGMMLVAVSFAFYLNTIATSLDAWYAASGAAWAAAMTAGALARGFQILHRVRK